MIKKHLAVLFLFVGVVPVSLFAQDVAQDSAQDEAGFVSLFDGKSLAGWNSARSTSQGEWGPFSVNEEEKAIHVYAGREEGSAQKNDCLYTDKDFAHYILKLEYKWVGPRFKPRPNWDRDAGLLFHIHGDLTKVWPLSLEMQIGESPADKADGKKPTEKRFHTGDLFVLGRQLRTDTARDDNKYYSKDGKVKTGGSVKTPLGTEKPMGEWNEMEIRVHGSEKATFVFNGEVVLETTNFTQKKQKDGAKTPLEKGRIGLQAEWAEIMYRNIRIKELPSETGASDSKMNAKPAGSGSKMSEKSEKTGGSDSKMSPKPAETGGSGSKMNEK